MSFTCVDKDTLTSYIYGECDAATRNLVDAHLATCAACADEVAAFGAVRSALAEWTPPECSVGFKIVRDEPAERGAAILRPKRWWQSPLPVWARAAAAILLLAGAAAIANVEVRYGRDGLVVRTGWQRAETVAADRAVTPQATTAVARSAAGEPAPWRADLAALEHQLRDEMRQQNAAALQAVATSVRPGGGPAVDEKRMLAQVRAMLGESEQRTQNEMAYRIAVVTGDLQTQRRADLLRVQQGFSATGAEVVRQRQAINNLFGVSLKK